MAASSSTSLPTTTALSLIRQQLHHLRPKLDLISQREQSLIASQAKSKSLRKVRRSKSVVSAQINLLENLFKAISSQQPNYPATSGAKRGRGFVAEDQFSPPMTKKSTPGQLRSCLNINATTAEAMRRYLCISNGIALCCLDLSKSQSFTSWKDVPPLPEIDTLNLLDDTSLPVSVGLFNLGSEAYMIGGQVFPNIGDRLRRFGENPEPFHLYRFLTYTHYIKSTPCTTYCLSLSDDGTLSCSLEPSIEPLKKSKYWPIVEKIDGQLHVIETGPENLYGCDPEWTFSHAVRNPDGHWIEINTAVRVSTTSKLRSIQSHVVVGDHIYAMAGSLLTVFDCKAQKWEVSSELQVTDRTPIKHVGHILRSGMARFAGIFPHRDADNQPLYVLIAVMYDNAIDKSRMYAAAYLVNLSGYVVGFQHLPDFFEGPARPVFKADGVIMKVDEEGKTMCVVLNGGIITKGGATDRRPGRHYLFVYTFTVEIVADVALKVRCGYKPVEQELVRVGMKSSHIFKTNAVELKKGVDLSKFVAMQACFL